MVVTVTIVTYKVAPLSVCVSLCQLVITRHFLAMYQLVLYACVRTSTIFLSMPPAALARFSDFFNVHVDQLAVDMLNVTRKEQQRCGVWLPVRVAT